MDGLDRAEYLPTPREIAEACEAIRARWSRNERRRRIAGGMLEDDPEPVWSPPLVDTSPLRAHATRGLADLAV